MPKAWVIGGCRGIGEEIAGYLNNHTFEVLATDEKTCDVGSTRDIAECLAEFKPQSIVYCAGYNKIMPAPAWDQYEAEYMFNINVLGFMRLIRLVAEDEEGDKPHKIIAIGSDAATHPMRNSMAYCASKAALHMAVRCAARELAPHVQINAIAPGIVEDTPMTDYTDEATRLIKGWSPIEAKAYEMQSIPMKRRAWKSEIAQMVGLLLKSPSYLTGSIIEINGGR